jgi:hypothetical protein
VTSLNRPSVYDGLVEDLAETYRGAHSFDTSGLRAQFDAGAARQTIFVGSGGALAVASLAASLFTRQRGLLGRAATPLGLVGDLPLLEAAVVMFSASGKHRDARTAIDAAVANNCRPITLVTHRRTEDLPQALTHEGVTVIQIPTRHAREGFLATNSVLSMATVTARAFGVQLPARLPYLTKEVLDAVREDTIVLFAPGQESVAVDIETRLAETGLSQAQVADYRNFAHGRHHGLARNLGRTTVVAIVADPFIQLAEATLGELPSDTHVICLRSDLQWPGSSMDLLVGAMRLVGTTAHARKVDPSRPHVAEFGRRLYHLPPSRSLVPETRLDPVQRKIAATHTANSTKLHAFFERSLETWLANIASVDFGGLVLDYDGTVCRTRERYELPSADVQKALLELLTDGTVVGFASGRGGSLWRDLRAWVPRKLWRNIELGLYNGGLQLSLADKIEPDGSPNGDLVEACRRIRRAIPPHLVATTERSRQVTVGPTVAGGISGEALARIAAEVIQRPPLLPLKVIASAHSVDVVPSDAVKALTLARVHERCNSPVLAIGDQGQLGGNDFDLLAATEYSLSVDRCSADPSRCWNLDSKALRGPDLLIRYLRALHRRKAGLRFRPRGL